MYAIANNMFILKIAFDKIFLLKRDIYLYKTTCSFLKRGVFKLKVRTRACGFSSGAQRYPKNYSKPCDIVIACFTIFSLNIAVPQKKKHTSACPYLKLQSRAFLTQQL